MNAEDVATIIRDALDILDSTEDETITEVVNDFSTLWLTTSDGQTFFVKVTRLES